MKTAGELLSSRRKQLELSVEDVENKLRIRKQYLLAMERDDFTIFSSPNYIRGFIKNYSEFLDLDSVKVLAVFRRQYADGQVGEIMPEGMHSPLDNPLLKITPQKAVVVSVLLILLVFFAYLFNQARGLLGAPTLELIEPAQDQVINVEQLTFKGKVNPEAELFFNGKINKASLDGDFMIEVEVIEGVNEFVLEAVNKNGKVSRIERNIRYQP